MRWPASVALLVLLTLAVSISAAAEPAQVLLSATPEWIVADGSSTSMIRITILDNTSSPVPNFTVSLLTDPLYGSVIPHQVNTDANGSASAIFSVKTVAGNTSVIVTAGNVINVTPLYLDHNVPAYMTVFYDPEVTTGKVTTITAHLEDRYHNPVDNRNVSSTDLEYADFNLVGGPSTGEITPGFLVNDTAMRALPGQYTDAHGNITVFFQTASVPADHLISIVPDILVLLPRTITIRSTASGVPYSFNQIINPTVQYQPADGKHNFTIKYYLLDEYGNRLIGYPILLDIMTPEGQFNQIINTSILGFAVLEYGPRSEPGLVDIVARVEENTNLSADARLDFYDPRPVSLSLMSMPSTLPSREVNTNITSRIIAKVTDEKGKGVENQTVFLTILHPPDYPDYQVLPPEFEGGGDDRQRSTDSDGLCEVQFLPGKFARYGEPDYTKFGNVQADVMATWNCSDCGGNITDNTTLNWRNYPYLSVNTSISNTTVEVNQTIDVTIQIRGEGLPINYREAVDIVFATARSRSMLEEYPDRMVYTYAAEHTFINLLRQSQPLPNTNDSIALLTSGGNPNGTPADILNMSAQFSKLAGEDTAGDEYDYIIHYPGNGRTDYNATVFLEVPFTSNLDKIDAAIDCTTPWDNKDYSQTPVNPVRKSLFDAITMLSGLSSPNRIKAVILLVDSEISDYGDPLAGADKGSPTYRFEHLNGGTNQYYPFNKDTWDPDVRIDRRQNMSVFAQNNNVRLYIVYAASKINENDNKTYRILADSTGGKYYWTTNASQIVAFYEEIAEELIKLSAMNSVMTIDMGEIEVNGDPVVQENSSIFQYIHRDYSDGEPYSTYLEYFWTANNTSINANYPRVEDQSEDYCDLAGGVCDHVLNFDIGNISVGQTWQAKYRLRVNVTGDIDIFGNTSVINFTNPYFGDLSYQIEGPPLSVLPRQDLQQRTEELRIEQFCCNESSCQQVCTAGSEIPLSWSIYYSGNKTVTQNLYIHSASGGRWKQFSTIHTPGNQGTFANAISMATRSLDDGVYQIRLEAYAPDAPKKLAQIVITVEKSPYFIQLR